MFYLDLLRVVLTIIAAVALIVMVICVFFLGGFMVQNS